MPFFSLALLAFSAFAQAEVRTGELSYYGRDFYAQPLKDEALKAQLFKVLSEFHREIPGDYDQIGGTCVPGKGCFRHEAYGYDPARSFLLGDFYLVKSANGLGVKDVYCQRVALSSEFLGAKPGPNVIPDARTLNTEHTWPQSNFTRAFPADLQKSDLHHLFPTDASVNSDRSSYDFGNVNTLTKKTKCGRLGSPAASRDTVYEPPLAHKGNVARAIFYFSVRYKMPVGRAQEETLREWNRLDPVDAEESARNERIFQLQHDRNPFVDYPALVDRITTF